MAESLEAYTSGVDSVKDGANSVSEGAQALDAYVNDLTDGYKSLLEQTSGGAAQYSAQASSIFASEENAKTAFTYYIGYESYGAALETIESTVQALLSKTASTISDAAAGNEALSSAAGTLGSLAGNDYVSADSDGNYTVDRDGFSTNLNTAAGVLSQVASALEDSAAQALDAAEATGDDSYVSAAAAAYESAGALGAAAQTITAEISAFDSTYSSFAGALAGIGSVTADGSTDDVGTKICTYFGYSGAAQALATINASLGESGITEDNMDAISEGSGELAEGARELAKGTESLASNNEAVNSGAEKLSGGAKTLYAGTKTLYKGAKTLDEGMEELLKGVGKLDAGAGKLAEGGSKLAEGSQTLFEGSEKLAEGAEKLADGLEQFKEEAIDPIVDAYEDDLQKFADRFEAITQAGDDYSTFAGLADGKTGTSKLVWKIGEIKAE